MRVDRDRYLQEGCRLSWLPKLSFPRLFAIGGWLVVVLFALHQERGPFWQVPAGVLYARALEALDRGESEQAVALLDQAAARATVPIHASCYCRSRAKAA